MSNHRPRKTRGSRFDFISAFVREAPETCCSGRRRRNNVRAEQKGEKSWCVMRLATDGNRIGAAKQAGGKRTKRGKPRSTKVEENWLLGEKIALQDCIGSRRWETNRRAAVGSSTTKYKRVGKANDIHSHSSMGSGCCANEPQRRREYQCTGHVVLGTKSVLRLQPYTSLHSRLCTPVSRRCYHVT